MKDVAVVLEDAPGSLARLGAALGAVGISIEGGGAFALDGRGIGHFLFAEGDAARLALEAAGIAVHAVRDVVLQQLDQATPGQLGQLTARMAAAGVNIEVLYSDHEHRLVLVVDDLARARQVADAWTRQRARARTDGRATGTAG